MQSEASVEIARPIAEVFEFTVTRVEDWSLTVVKDEATSDGPPMVGSTFRITTSERGKEMTFEGTVTRHEPPQAHSSVLKGKQFEIDVAYTFEDLGGKTRVTQKSEVEGKGFTKVMFSLMGWMMKKAGCKAAQKELDHLKACLENDETTAQSAH